MSLLELKKLLGEDNFTTSQFKKILRQVNSKKEIWKDIKGYEGLYKVSNIGRVKSLKRQVNKNRAGEKWVPEIILKPGQNVHGYWMVGLHKSGKSKNASVHRLVAMAFIPNPQNKTCVNHKKGIKKDNRVSELEWATYSENEKHSFDVLGKRAYQPMKGRFGFDHNRSRPVWQIDLVKTKIKKFGSQWEAHRKTGISQGNIGMCVRGERKTAGGYIWM